MNLLLSALEDPKKRLPQLRHSFSQSDFRDESAREIYGSCVTLLEGQDGINDQEITGDLQDRLGLRHPVFFKWLEVSSWSRAGLREDGEFQTLLRRMGEVKQRHDVAALMDKFQKVETPRQAKHLVKQMVALERPRRTIADQARVNVAEYANVRQDQAHKLLPGMVWNGFIREGSMSIIAGESKAKKSWLALSLLQHSIMGEPFLERAMVPPSSGKPRRVFLMDFEMPSMALVARWVRLAGEFDWEDKAALFDPDRVSLECYRTQMTTPRDWVAFICDQISSRCQPGDIALVDCLQPILGAANSNAVEEVRPLLNKIQAVADQTGAAVLLVDHFNKGMGRGKDRVSGSMAKVAAPDTVITLNSAEGLIEIRADLRLDPPQEPFFVEMRNYSFLLVTEEQLQERKQAAKDKDLREFVESLPLGWFTGADLAGELGIHPDTARRRLKRCSEWVETKQEGTKFLYSRIPGARP